MKKNLWYLVALFCCLNFFACGDDDNGKDDDDDDDKDWTDYTGTFGEDNPLLLNGEKIEDGSVTAVFAKGTTDGKAKLTLKGLGLWEQETVIFDDLTVTEKEGNYVFESTEDLGDTDSKLKVIGTLAPGSRTRDVGPTPVSLTLTTKRTIDSDLVGKWKLKYNEGIAGFGFTTNNQMFAQYAQQLGLDIPIMVGGLISQKVNEVEVNFKEDGSFAVAWTSVDGTTTSLGDIPMVGVYLEAALEYYVEGNVVKVGLDGTIIDLLAEIGGSIPAVAEYLPYLQYIDLVLDSQNGYYSLPINFEIKGGEAKFYMNEAKLIPLLQAAPNIIPEAIWTNLMAKVIAQVPVAPGYNMDITVGMLYDMIEPTDELEVSLTFTK